MGTASSIHSSQTKENSSNKNYLRKSIKGEFEKEFGKKFDNDEQINDKSSEGEKPIMLNPAIFRAKRLFMKPITKQRPKNESLVVKKQNNSGLVKEIYRRLDPTVTTVSSQTIVGQIEIAAKYKPLEKTLLVKVGRVKQLVKEGVGLPDPYVTIDLFPSSDPSKALTHKTNVKSDTCNPIFHEILVFPIIEQQIANTTLRVTVWDKDLISQDDFLGESIIQLCKLDLVAGNSMWYKLYPQTDVSITGTVNVTLTYVEPNKVTVIVDHANHLKVCNVVKSTSSPYVRVFITGIPSKHETHVIQNELNPEWNSSFEFDVHPDEFSRRIIVLNVMNKSESGKDQRMGDVHLPMLEFDIENSGISQRYNLQDLRNSPHSRSKWSEEGLSIEFREAMIAHAIYGYPKFLFKTEHKGKMVVSCRSVKARAETKMIISNGIPSVDEVQM